MVPPGLRRPSFSASSTIWRAARSLTEWPGFMCSALAKMRQPVAAESDLSSISGVCPTLFARKEEVKAMTIDVEQSEG